MSYLTKAKSVLSHYGDPESSHQAKGNEILATVPNDEARHYLMRVMVDWNERASMMTCGDLTAAQAEMAAWHDLGLDAVFFRPQKYH